MKKIFFLFAMVSVASIAMAQTTVINQTVVGDPNASVQIANVDQTGNSNVKITQLTDKTVYESNPETKAEFNNTATAIQKGGDGNKITVKQEATDMINGGSTENKTYAHQDGKNNTIKQTQISGNFTSGGMDFTAKQKGQENIGEQYGKKTNGVFEMTQDGKKNEAYQKTTGEKTGNLTAYIKQVGDENTATQLFHGQNVRYAGAEIIQTADHNTAKQEFDLGGQSTIYGAAINSSKALIKQTGNWNDAYQMQSGQGSYQEALQSGTSNDADMYSYGNYNEAYAIQKGENGTVKITQKQDESGLANAGDGNLAKVSQDGIGSTAIIMQDGLNNVVSGLGGEGTYAINNNGAYLKVSQTGEDNIVMSSQLTSIASATITQSGFNNEATVNQH